MKVYLNSAKENWVIDRFRKEWYTSNNSISTKLINKSDIVWIISPWTWRKININKLSKKKVICSIYHLDEDKFNENDLKEFNFRDKYVDIYHVISENTKKPLLIKSAIGTFSKTLRWIRWNPQVRSFNFDLKSSFTARWAI